MIYSQTAGLSKANDGRRKKTPGDHTIKENREWHWQCLLHPPYFTLTSEGATALKKFIVQKGVRLDEKGGVPTGIMREFLAENLKLKVVSTEDPELDVQDCVPISHLLGVASRGHVTDVQKLLPKALREGEEDDTVLLDPLALDIIERNGTPSKEVIRRGRS